MSTQEYKLFTPLVLDKPYAADITVFFLVLGCDCADNPTQNQLPRLSSLQEHLHERPNCRIPQEFQTS